MNRKPVIFLVIAFIIISISACLGGQAGTPVPPPAEVAAPAQPAEPAQTAPSQPTSAPPGGPAAPAPGAGPQPLPADPQKIEFSAADGEPLLGTYYPAAVNPAPLVVLFHWARGYQYDWVEIALWLQNREHGGGGPENPQDHPWLDASWFPSVPTGASWGGLHLHLPRL